MKFIHISDIHYGIIPDPLMPWSKERTLDIKDSFASVVKKCKEDRIDLLLISGDFFNHQPLSNELNEVNELFKTIPNTKVLIIAGSNDCIKSNSPVLNYVFNENVYYFLNQVPDDVEIFNTNITIHGFSYYAPEETSAMVDSINIPNDKRIHILLAYGGDNRHCPIDFQALSKKNFSYCALGSSHSFKLVYKNVAYSGSLEPLSKIETFEHGIIIGEINDKTCRLEKLDFLPIAKTKYIPIKITVNSKSSHEDVIEAVNKEVSANGLNNIYILELVGMRDPDVEFTIDNFSDKIKICDFIDNTEPKYDFVKLSKEHPQDMIGTYIRHFVSENKELSQIEKKALYYGTHALMKTLEKNEE